VRDETFPLIEGLGILQKRYVIQLDGRHDEIYAQVYYVGICVQVMEVWPKAQGDGLDWDYQWRQ
jgi:hypothetical protein